MRNSAIITAVDLGTSKIRTIVAETNSDEENINILGYAEKSSENGIIKGEITDVNKVSQILKEVMIEAEQKSETYILSDSLYVGVTGNHIGSKDSSGTVLINNSDRKVAYSNVEEALRNARSLLLPPDARLLNSIDGYFVLDNTQKVTDPIGHTASKMEAHTHIVYGNKNRIENVESIIKEQGFDNCFTVFKGLASALAVMTEDDFIHGTLTINIGAGTSEYILFNDYTVKDTGVFSLGCDHIANDLFLGLDVNIAKAKDILMSHSHIARKEEGHGTIDIQSSFNNREIPITSVEKIIELRIREMFEVICNRIKSKRLTKLLSNGIILCGGIANLPYAVEIARNVFEMPVRAGIPLDMSGSDSILKDPGNITTLGLLRYAKKDVQARMEAGDGSLVNKFDHKISTMFKKVWGVMK